ncbi:hypothetical protein B0H19DRAFT_1103482 [Mycena capillaripes]|nr:hypothetical protein B0H19DRAFT_1103482 [Mycena capillaripes]
MDQTGVAQEGSKATPVRVDDLWFPTDTIVIRAENRMFRVSGGILAARSTVFRDMVAFPQPEVGDIDSEHIDGCHVVRLHDSADDVEVFLRAIYDSSYFMPAPASIDLTVVLGILRLSHKYDVEYLCRRALDHLAVDGWYLATYDGTEANHLHYILSKSPINALSVIVAASEVGAQWILPSAYYHASTFDPDDLLPFCQGKMEKHVQKCLAAHQHLLRAQALSKFLEGLAEKPWFTVFSTLEKDLDALEQQRMCTHCLTLAKSRQKAAASRFWDELPRIFGLPPWDKLRAMKRAAMGEDADDDQKNDD